MNIRTIALAGVGGMALGGLISKGFDEDRGVDRYVRGTAMVGASTAGAVGLIAAAGEKLFSGGWIGTTGNVTPGLAAGAGGLGVVLGVWAVRQLTD